MRSPRELTSSRGAVLATMHKNLFAEKRVQLSGPRQLLLVVLLLVLAGGIWYLFFSLNYYQEYGDGLDYAQIAENVYSSKGMVTKTYPLFGLNFLQARDLIDKEWPNLHRFPMPIYMTALMFRLFGVNNFAVAIWPGLLYVLSIPLLYLLSRRMLRSTLNALFLTAIVMLNPIILRYSIANTTEMASILLFLLLIYVLQTSCGYKYLLAGLILGVFYYNRYNIILFVPILTLFIILFEQENKGRNVLGLIGAFVVVVLPWFAYNYRHAGYPLFSLTAEADFPVYTDKYPYLHSLWFGLDDVHQWEFLLAYPGQVLIKWVGQLRRTAQHFPWLVGDNVYLFAFFFVGLFAIGQDPKKTRLKLLVLILFISQVLVMSFYVNVARFYAYFIPFFILFGFDYFTTVVTHLPLKKWIQHSFIILLVIFSCAYGVKEVVKGPRYRGVDFGIGSEMQKNLSSLNASVSPGDVTSSDIVVATGMYVAGRSIPLPKDYETLKRTQKEFLPVNYILLSDYVLTKEIWKEWWPVFQERRGIEGFTLHRVFSDGTLLYLSEDWD